MTQTPTFETTIHTCIPVYETTIDQSYYNLSEYYECSILKLKIN